MTTLHFWVGPRDGRCLLCGHDWPHPLRLSDYWREILQQRRESSR